MLHGHAFLTRRMGAATRLPGWSYVTSPYSMMGRTTCTITSMMK
jgi:hypothetical protein